MKRLILAVLFGLAACSHVDTGEIDYRRAEPETNFRQNVSGYPASCGPVAVQYTTPARSDQRMKDRDFTEQKCNPLLSARLFRKNAAIGDPIDSGQVYSMRLEHGLIAYMTEPAFSFRRLFSFKDPRRKVGEVVVLANVFEFSPPTQEGAALGFRDFTSFEDAKVIYYNPDVEEGQDLNFSNIPLQAPVEYGGRPVGIQIIVMELDGMSTQLRGLLKQLSLMGQESNLLPGGAASNILLELGTSLLTENNDDIVFEYRFVLDPSDGSPNARSAAFEAGRYVLRRSDERLDDQIWRNLELDHNTGKLMWSKAAANPREPFESDTYFTINIIKHYEKSAAAAFGFKAMRELRAEIEAAASDRDAPIDLVKERLLQKAFEMQAKQWGADLAAAWEKAANRYRAYARRVPPETAPAGCRLVELDLERLGLAEYEARRTTAAFIRLFQEARAARTKEAKPRFAFPETEQQYVLDAMGSYFAPLTDNPSIEHLIDPDAFAARYTSDDGGISLFLNAMHMRAMSKYRPEGCNELISVGLALPLER